MLYFVARKLRKEAFKEEVISDDRRYYKIKSDTKTSIADPEQKRRDGGGPYTVGKL